MQSSSKFEPVRERAFSKAVLKF